MIYIQLQDQLQSITINNIQLQDWYNDLQSILRPITFNYIQLQDRYNDLQWFACNYKTNTMIYNQLQPNYNYNYNDLQPI